MLHGEGKMVLLPLLLLGTKKLPEVGTLMTSFGCRPCTVSLACCVHCSWFIPLSLILRRRVPSWTGWILHSMFLIWNGLWFRRLGFFLLIGLPLVVSWGHFCVAGSTGGTKSFLMMLLGLMLLLMSCLVCINSRGRLLPCGLPFFSPVTFLSRAISVGCCGVFVAFGCHVVPKLSID